MHARREREDHRELKGLWISTFLFPKVTFGQETDLHLHELQALPAPLVRAGPVVSPSLGPRACLEQLGRVVPRVPAARLERLV